MILSYQLIIRGHHRGEIRLLVSESTMLVDYETGETIPKEWTVPYLNWECEDNASNRSILKVLKEQEFYDEFSELTQELSIKHEFVTEDGKLIGITFKSTYISLECEFTYFTCRDNSYEVLNVNNKNRYVRDLEGIKGIMQRQK